MFKEIDEITNSTTEIQKKKNLMSCLTKNFIVEDILKTNLFYFTNENRKLIKIASLKKINLFKFYV